MKLREMTPPGKKVYFLSCMRHHIYLPHPSCLAQCLSGNDLYFPLNQIAGDMKAEAREDVHRSQKEERNSWRSDI